MEQLSGPVPAAEQASELARFVVRTIAAATGRGPTRARAHINTGVITVVLRDTLTKPELRLLDHDRHSELLVARRAIYDTVRIRLTDGAEQLTGRRVASLHLDHELDADVVVIVFVMEEGGRPGEDDAAAAPRADD